MQLKFSRAGLNKSIQAMLDYMMRQKLYEQEQEGRMTAIGEEQRGRMEYQTAQERANQALEKTEHANRMTQLNESLRGELLRMPTIARLRAEAENLRSKGDEEGARLKDDQSVAEAGNLGRLAYLSQYGERATEPELTRAVHTAQDALLSILGEGGAERRSMRAADVERTGQQVRREELVQQGTGENRQQFNKDRDVWIAHIKDVSDVIDRQGVADKAQPPSMFGSGKAYDPLSSADRGSALASLALIRDRTLRGQMPSQEESRFMAEVLNSSKVKAEGALPSPETGRWPSEQRGLENRIKDAQELEFVRNAMTNYNVKESTARQLYKEFLKEKARAIQQSRRIPAEPSTIK